MRSLIGVFTALTLVFGVITASPAIASEKISKETMVKFVKEAVAHAKKVGQKQAADDFSDLKGNWVRNNGELYMYGYDYSGLNLAHGGKPALRNNNLIKMQDKKGLFLIEKLRDTAKAGSGFVEFFWENPTTKKVEHKLGYVEKVDDQWWIGSGIYLGD